MRLLSMTAALFAPLLDADARFMPQSLPREVDRPGIVDRGTRSAGPTFDRNLRDLRGDIRASQRAGELSPGDARELRREARQIAVLSERYGRDGVSESERRELDMRVQALRGLASAKRNTARD